MDTATLAAQLKEAEAAHRQAEHQLDQAKALVVQRESELTFAQQELDRAEELASKGIAPRQLLEQRRAAKATAEAALRSAKAQVSSAQAAIEVADARVAAVKVQIADSTLVAPRSGRVQYRLALPGEVLPAGGRVITLLDLTDVYMTIFLPTRDAGRLALGSEARLVLDAAPKYVVPAIVTYVASNAQFTPKYVETESEREKLMFRIKLKIPRDILEKYAGEVKTGLTGVAYVKVARDAVWPASLQVKLPS
jgi:HlyD family secretion protein